MSFDTAALSAVIVAELPEELGEAEDEADDDALLLPHATTTVDSDARSTSLAAYDIHLCFITLSLLTRNNRDCLSQI
jgi:hypothetical protein